MRYEPAVLEAFAEGGRAAVVGAVAHHPALQRGYTERSAVTGGAREMGRTQQKVTSERSDHTTPAFTTRAWLVFVEFTRSVSPDPRGYQAGAERSGRREGGLWFG